MFTVSACFQVLPHQEAGVPNVAQGRDDNLAAQRQANAALQAVIASLLNNQKRQQEAIVSQQEVIETYQAANIRLQNRVESLEERLADQETVADSYHEIAEAASEDACVACYEPKTQ